MNILKELQDQLGESFVEKASTFLGLSAEQTSPAVEQVLPVFLGFLSHRTSNHEGAQAFINTHAAAHEEPEAEAESNEPDSSSQVDKGQALLGDLCGSDLTSLQEAFASLSGLSSKQSNSLLALAAPGLSDVFKKTLASKKLDTSDVSPMLAKQLARLTNPLPIPDAPDFGKIGERVSDATSSAMEGSSEAVSALTKGLGTLGASAAATMAEVASSAKETAEAVAERVSGDNDPETQILSAETFQPIRPEADETPEEHHEDDTLTSLLIVEDTGAVSNTAAAALAAARNEVPENEEEVVDKALAAVDAARTTIAGAGKDTFLSGSSLKNGIPDTAHTAGMVMGGAAAGSFESEHGTALPSTPPPSSSGNSWLKYLLGALVFLLVLWQLSTCSTPVEHTVNSTQETIEPSNTEAQIAVVVPTSEPAEPAAKDEEAAPALEPSIDEPTKSTQTVTPTYEVIAEQPLAGTKDQETQDTPAETPEPDTANTEQAPVAPETTLEPPIAISDPTPEQVITSAANKPDEPISGEGQDKGERTVALPGGVNLSLSNESPVDQIVSFLKNQKDSAPQTFILRGLNFESGSDQITEASRKIVDDLAATMRAFSKSKIQLNGHTDSQGNDQGNLQLSISRADSVRQTLLNADIDAMRVQSKGFGESKPIAENTSTEGRLENRRVEVVILEK